jgi:hypothetical protein
MGPLARVDHAVQGPVCLLAAVARPPTKRQIRLLTKPQIRLPIKPRTKRLIKLRTRRPIKPRTKRVVSATTIIIVIFQ